MAKKGIVGSVVNGSKDLANNVLSGLSSGVGKFAKSIVPKSRKMRGGKRSRKSRGKKSRRKSRKSRKSCMSLF